MFINIISLIAQFYVALYPVGSDPLDASTFFQLYLAGPLLIFLYLGWKIYSWFYRPSDRPLFIRAKDIDIYTGMREGQRTLISGEGIPEDQRRASIIEMQEEQKKKGVKDYIMAGIRNVI